MKSQRFAKLIRIHIVVTMAIGVLNYMTVHLIVVEIFCNHRQSYRVIHIVACVAIYLEMCSTCLYHHCFCTVCLTSATNTEGIIKKVFSHFHKTIASLTT